MLVDLARVIVCVRKQLSAVCQVATLRCFDGTLVHGDDLGERQANDFEVGVTRGRARGSAGHAARGSAASSPPRGGVHEPRGLLLQVRRQAPRGLHELVVVSLGVPLAPLFQLTDQVNNFNVVGHDDERRAPPRGSHRRGARTGAQKGTSQDSRGSRRRRNCSTAILLSSSPSSS